MKIFFYGGLTHSKLAFWTLVDTITMFGVIWAALRVYWS